MKNARKTIAILGDGGWGTALAILLHQNGHDVTVWGPFPEYVETLNREHFNPLYLPEVKIPDSIRFTADRAAAVAGADVAVLAIPTRFFRSALEPFAQFLPESCELVSVSKGLDPGMRCRMTEVAAGIFPGRPVAALSGPSHAEEVARGMPTAVVIASRDARLARKLQRVFMCPRFRIYTSSDVAGIEYGGAFKNVIAIAVGASDALGFGNNTRAALITRGLAEITRLGCKLGARPETFAGLSGMGDLIVTCTSGLSRNHSVGERLGRGESAESIVGGMKQVAEGVSNCGLVRDLAQEAGVSAPIIEEVYSLIRGRKKPLQAVHDLMTRDARPELDL